MRKQMLIVLLLFCLVLSGCTVPPDREVTKIYPVIEYITADGGISAVFDVGGQTKSCTFNVEDIYSCEESSRVIHVYREVFDGEDLEEAKGLFLYLNDADYKEYIKQRYDLE